MPTSQNRTKWGLKGGAVAFQPGWFAGHKTAFIYINLGIGTIPLNMSLAMVPVFQIVGPTNSAYPGTFCLPQVPLPPNITVNVGDNATIQIVEAAVHGAALYSVSLLTVNPSSLTAAVRRHHIRRGRGRAAGQQLQLLQLVHRAGRRRAHGLQLRLHGRRPGRQLRRRGAGAVQLDDGPAAPHSVALFDRVMKRMGLTRLVYGQVGLSTA